MRLGWRDPWCSGIFDRRPSWGYLASTWGQIFKNAPVGLKFDRNNPNNILTRFRTGSVPCHHARGPQVRQHSMSFSCYFRELWTRAKWIELTFELKLNMNNPNNILNRFTFDVIQGQRSTWSQFFQNVLIWLKFDMNDHDNIVNRLNLLSRSSKVKGQLEVRFAKCSDWAQIWQKWSR